MSTTARRETVLMMAGGTGGHVYPALAIAAELLGRGYELHWVGSDRGLENRVVPAAGIELHHLAVRGVRGKNLLHTLLGLLRLMLAQVQAVGLLWRLRPACVVGMGGYASGPGGLAAWLLRSPLVIHEQNAVAGTANRLLAPLASAVLCGFKGAFGDRKDTKVVGNPVRAELLSRAAESPFDFDGSRPLRLLVLGGSLGARPINQVMPETLERVMTANGPASVEVRHQSGEAHLDDVRASYSDEQQTQVSVSAFIDDMAGAYAWSDLVICRAGALTVAELAVMGRPSVLVPLPHAIDDHQTANARALADPGGGLLLPQSEMSAEGLARIINDYLAEPARLATMAGAASAAAYRDATSVIGDRCEELMHAA